MLWILLLAWSGRTSVHAEELSYLELPVAEGAAWQEPADDDAASSLEPYYDVDAYLASQPPGAEGPWTWQILPEGLIYRPYLANPKTSRLATHLVNIDGDGWIWDAWLGTQVGILRWGTYDTDWPVGFQLDVEGSAQARLDMPENIDVRSVDFRGGVPLSFGLGRHRTKVGYYHISSHLGDEFLIKNPTFDRVNYARDALILGHSIYLSPSTRVYAEAGWAFYTDVSKEWEFQFGIDHAPAGPTSSRGEPFFALNGHLREDVNYGGGLTAQAGWAWRGESGRMLRTGLQYYNGPSPQYSFFNQFEQHVGFGLWYDP